MAKNSQKPYVRIWHGRLLAQFKFVGGSGKACPTHKIEPLLHVVLVGEFRFVTFAFCVEKQVDVELVGFVIERKGLYVIGHLVGKKHHTLP